MKAGLLDRRIVIEQYTQTQNNFGELVPSWSTWNTVWADLIPVKGNEGFMAARKTEQAEFRVRMRYISGLTEDMRLNFQSKTWDILSINELGRQEGWEIIIKQHKNMQ